MTKGNLAHRFNSEKGYYESTEPKTIDETSALIDKKSSAANQQTFHQPSSKRGLSALIGTAVLGIGILGGYSLNNLKQEGVVQVQNQTISPYQSYIDTIKEDGSIQQYAYELSDDGLKTTFMYKGKPNEVDTKKVFGLFSPNPRTDASACIFGKNVAMKYYGGDEDGYSKDKSLGSFISKNNDTYCK